MSDPRIPANTIAWERDFTALCKKHKTDAAYYVPRCRGEDVYGAFVGGSREACTFLEVLVHHGSKRVNELDAADPKEELAVALRAACEDGFERMRAAAVNIINEARCEGETDLRQVRNWIQAVQEHPDEHR